MFPSATPTQWSDNHVIRQACDALTDDLATRWPNAATRIRTDPLAGIGYIDGLRVVDDRTARGTECPIDGTYDPETTTIRYRRTGNTGRDNFTLLHELGHHLLAINEQWCYDIAPALDRANVGKTVEELLVSTFASRTLIPDDIAAQAFRRGVTAQAVAELNRTTEASATACLVRALSEPGHRLVMLTDHVGQPWFAQTTGEPWSPGTRTRQPAIEAAAARAIDSDGNHRLDGGEGLRFGTGNTNHRVVFDVNVDGSLVFVIVETTAFDARIHNPRARDDSATWTLDCVAGCGNTFTTNESPGRCQTCGENKCPRCRGCECNQPAFCARCTLALPTARAHAGHALCEECE